MTGVYTEVEVLDDGLKKMYTDRLQDLEQHRYDLLTDTWLLEKRLRAYERRQIRLLRWIKVLEDFVRPSALQYLRRNLDGELTALGDS